MNLGPLSFGAPAAGLFALAAIPVIIVYFLKLRRPRRDVPSLALWRRVMEDQRVNSPFQKFRRNLLLWLQLALLAALVLACMRPLLTAGSSDAESLPIVVDCSASMAAVDEPDGLSRLDRVKADLLEEFDALPSGREVALIAAGGRGIRLCDFTANRAVLRDAVSKLQPTPGPAKLADALRLAEGMTQARRVDEVRLHTDGNLPVPSGQEEAVAVIPFDLPFEVDLRRVGPPAGSTPENVGVVEMNARRSGAGAWEVFVRVAASEKPARADLTLKHNGEVIRSEPVVLEAGQSQRLTFSLVSSTSAAVTAELRPKQHDALAMDDRARLDLPPARDLRVSVDGSLGAFRHAIDGAETVSLVETAADLSVTSDPKALSDESAVLLVGAIPEDLAEVVEFQDESAVVVDWQRSDPLLRHVQLNDLQLLKSPAFKSSKGRKDVEAAGWRVVAEVEGGPLIVRRQNGRRVTYSLLFDPDLSTLPFRVGFPVMVANLLDVGSGQAELSAVRGLTAGPLPPLAVDSSGDHLISGPGDYEQTVEADAGQLLRGVVAPDLGDYIVRHDGEAVREFGVSLLNASESSLVGVEQVRFSEVTVEANADQVAADRPLWRWLALAALALLVGEWWYFHRPATSSARPRTAFAA